MATKQEKATAKAKALKGGMNPAAADKIFKMSSKGVYNMTPGHSKNKSMSDLNMSNKDELMMKALYMPEPDKKQKKHEPGTSYGYKEKEGGVRGGFNKAFKRAKEEGYDTFSFGYDKNKDGAISFQQGEVKRYSTKTK
jgi:hypothetical protein